MAPPVNVRRTTAGSYKQRTAVGLHNGANNSEESRPRKRQLDFAQTPGLKKKVEKLQKDELEKLQKELSDLRLQVSGQAPPSSASHDFLSTSSVHPSLHVATVSAMHRRRNDDSRNARQTTHADHLHIPASLNTHAPTVQTEVRHNGTVFLGRHVVHHDLAPHSGHHEDSLSGGLMIAAAVAGVHVAFCLVACCYWCLALCRDLQRRGFTVYLGQGKDGRPRLRFMGKKDR
mmetsp:Transcript_102067/g.161045  ORF Transcript_102067/g.161045 Transcript_102067/m.161045 type:complete len:231 (+) Transcript_102067:59-751(+)